MVELLPVIVTVLVVLWIAKRIFGFVFRTLAAMFIPLIVVGTVGMVAYSSMAS